MWGQAQKVGQAAPGPIPSYLSVSISSVHMPRLLSALPQVRSFPEAELSDVAKLADRIAPRIHPQVSAPRCWRYRHLQPHQPLT